MDLTALFNQILVFFDNTFIKKKFSFTFSCNTYLAFIYYSKTFFLEKKKLNRTYFNLFYFLNKINYSKYILTIFSSQLLHICIHFLLLLCVVLLFKPKRSMNMNVNFKNKKVGVRQRARKFTRSLAYFLPRIMGLSDQYRIQF